MNRIKITCTAEQRLRFINVMAGACCPFISEPCVGDADCFKCIEDRIDWEIVEPVKDFKKLTIEEFEEFCDDQRRCNDCIYLDECAHAFFGREVKEPGVALGNRIVKDAMNKED